MSRSLDELVPEVRDKARQLLADLDRQAIRYLVTETGRKQIVQLAYWLRSRAEVETVVSVYEAAGLRGISEAEAKQRITTLDGITRRSMHQDGRAFDLVPLGPDGRALWIVRNHVELYKRIGEAARRCGLRWGGDFLPLDPVTGIGWDPVHFEA